MSLAAWREPMGCAQLRDGVRHFAVHAGRGECMLFDEPEREEGWLAVGALRVLEAVGPGRFAALERNAEALLAELDGAEHGARLVGGFAFAAGGGGSQVWRGFPPARLVLPELLFVRARGEAWCVATASGDSVEHAREAARTRARAAAQALASQPRSVAEGAGFAAPADAENGLGDAPAHYTLRAEESAAGFAGRVADALAAIGAGELEKVVPARAVEIARAGGGWNVPTLLHGLRREHPSCTLYAVARGGRVFLGATPEPLLRLDGRRLETAAVAGTAPRGRTPEEDAARARALVESKKEQHEHAAVVRDIRARLAPLATRIDAPEAPRLMQLANVQHLLTPIVAELARPTHALQLVGRLHPTPAVAGTPREAALEWLAKHEALDRGWYAGPLGWLDASGGAHFCVALRAALLGEATARCFAGAGVVEGSQPAAESRETRAKLDALLRPLLEL